VPQAKPDYANGSLTLETPCPAEKGPQGIRRADFRHLDAVVDAPIAVAFINAEKTGHPSLKQEATFHTDGWFEEYIL
jgi:hypothetical protein